MSKTENQRRTIPELWAESDRRTQEIIDNPWTLKNILPYLVMLLSGEIPPRRSS